MKILFLCGSAEPGKDGVGDYTRQLCGELIRMGHQALIISLCDKQADNYLCQSQLIEVTSVMVRRIPIATSFNQRLTWTQEIIKEEAPDWISLQFVPYSFHPKGLPYWMPSFLNKLKGDYKWHIMFHEMWIGISVISPLKHKITGYFQRLIAKKIITTILPSSISTSNFLYQLVLDAGGISTEILPLFSNIPIVKIDDEFKKDLFSNLKIKEIDIDNYLFTGVFGSIYPEANLDMVLNELLERATSSNKKLVFISFGKIEKEGEKKLEKLMKDFSQNIQFLNFGILNEKRISTLLQLLNIGISCTPYQHLGKSGVYAAMKLHGLEIMISCREEIPEYTIQLQEKMQEFINRPSEMWSAEYVARNFISLIK